MGNRRKKRGRMKWICGLAAAVPLVAGVGHKHKEYAKGVLFYSGFPHERELIGEVIELDTALSLIHI